MKPTNTLLLALTALVALSTAKADGPIKWRPMVLINAVKDKNGLTPKDPMTNMVNVENAPWATPDEQPFCIAAVGAPAEFSTWTPYSFTFVAEADGYVWLSLAGQYSGKGEANNLHVDFDDVSYEGAPAAANGDFEEIDANGVVDKWKFNKAVLPVGSEAAYSGEAFVTVNANNTATQAVEVTAGKAVTVSFYARTHKD